MRMDLYASYVVMAPGFSPKPMPPLLRNLATTPMALPSQVPDKAGDLSVVSPMRIFAELPTKELVDPLAALAAIDGLGHAVNGLDAVAPLAP